MVPGINSELTKPLANMKKKYFSPETAAMEVQFTSVLCGSGMGEENMKNENNSFGAPGRKAF